MCHFSFIELICITSLTLSLFSSIGLLGECGRLCSHRVDFFFNLCLLPKFLQTSYFKISSETWEGDIEYVVVFFFSFVLPSSNYLALSSDETSGSVPVEDKTESQEVSSFGCLERGAGEGEEPITESSQCLISPSVSSHDPVGVHCLLRGGFLKLSYFHTEVLLISFL